MARSNGIETKSQASTNTSGIHHTSTPALWITGLGSQYPPYLLGSERFEQFAGRFHDLENAGIKRLLKLNRLTGIEARSSVSAYETGFGTEETVPSITEVDTFFREAGVNLAVQACRKALKEWGGEYGNITHTIAVTCTNQMNPGYDILVNSELGLRNDIDRTLLAGVGCAGGLSIMRAAAQIASGAAMRRRPARVLCYACELCTPLARMNLEEAANCKDLTKIHIAAALFSDAAAAFVLCNEYGMSDREKALFQLMEWDTATIPDSIQYMGFYGDPYGYRTILAREVPLYTKQAIGPMFQRLLPSFREQVGNEDLNVADFDWALHPGGTAIMDGAKEMVGLTEDQLRASREIYRTYGNSASTSVLAVLNRLRSMGPGRDHVVATSFGPGLSIEMAMLRRCRSIDEDE